MSLLPTFQIVQGARNWSGRNMPTWKKWKHWGDHLIRYIPGLIQASQRKLQQYCNSCSLMREKWSNSSGEMHPSTLIVYMLQKAIENFQMPNGSIERTGVFEKVWGQGGCRIWKPHNEGNGKVHTQCPRDQSHISEDQEVMASDQVGQAIPRGQQEDQAIFPRTIKMHLVTMLEKREGRILDKEAKFGETK